MEHWAWEEPVIMANGNIKSMNVFMLEICFVKVEIYRSEKKLTLIRFLKIGRSINAESAIFDRSVK